MQQTMRFHPEVVEWWLELRALAERLGRVTVWRALDHPPQQAGELSQHPTVTLVACLRGTVRVQGRQHLDLAPGDVLLLQAGAWHGHPTLRRGAVAYMQGFIAGRSDYHLASAEILSIASIPAQPYRRLLDEAARCADEGQCRRLVVEAISSMVRERTEPLAAPHPALLAMEYELYTTLHLPTAITRVVRASGLSRAQAYRLAHEHWGNSLASLRRHLRTTLADELAINGVAEEDIATRCGFNGVLALRRGQRMEHRTQ